MKFPLLLSFFLMLLFSFASFAVSFKCSSILSANVSAETVFEPAFRDVFIKPDGTYKKIKNPLAWEIIDPSGGSVGTLFGILHQAKMEGLPEGLLDRLDKSSHIALEKIRERLERNVGEDYEALFTNGKVIEYNHLLTPEMVAELGVRNRAVRIGYEERKIIGRKFFPGFYHQLLKESPMMAERFRRDFIAFREISFQYFSKRVDQAFDKDEAAKLKESRDKALSFLQDDILGEGHAVTSLSPFGVEQKFDEHIMDAYMNDPVDHLLNSTFLKSVDLDEVLWQRFRSRFDGGALLPRITTLDSTSAEDVFGAIEQAYSYERMVESISKVEGNIFLSRSSGVRDLMSAYYEGDLGRLIELGGFLENDESEYNRLLLTNRNLNWLPKIKTITEQLSSGETYFVGVGFLHLLGPGGLLSLLEQEGYTVNRMHFDET